MQVQSPIQLQNNFAALKDDFKKDTGFEFSKENMNLYIQYFNARMNDKNYQVLYGLTNQLLNKLNFIPGEIRLEIAEMIRSHEVFKQILQKNL